jgi:hypothetical protein
VHAVHPRDEGEEEVLVFTGDDLIAYNNLRMQYEPGLVRQAFIVSGSDWERAKNLLHQD